MFMAKSELKNAMQLTKIRLDNTKRNRVWFLLIILTVILGNLIPSLISIFKQTNGVAEYRLQDYSITFGVGILIAITIMACSYKTTNQFYSVYPQTNNSRFLSSQALWYIWILCVAVVSLLIYVIQYSVLAVIAAYQANIILVYNFDLGFVISGFFVLIVYLAIITAIITLIAVLIRKFRIYAILSFVLFAAFVITNVPKMIELFKVIFGFLIFESNPALFILKGIILWVVLFGVALFINKHTVYYESGIKISKTIIAVITVIGIITIGVTPFLFYNTTTSQSVSEREDKTSELYRWYEIVIDASAIPNGSTINVVAPNIKIMNTTNEFITYDGENMDMYLEFDKDIFSNFNGEKIIISYCLPTLMIDYYELSKLANPKLATHLEGNTLYLDYSYDKNIKAVFIPVWSFMWQFDGFKGRNIFKEFNGSAYGSGNGSVYITVE